MPLVSVRFSGLSRTPPPPSAYRMSFSLISNCLLNNICTLGYLTLKQSKLKLHFLPKSGLLPKFMSVLAVLDALPLLQFWTLSFNLAPYTIAYHFLNYSLGLGFLNFGIPVLIAPPFPSIFGLNSATHSLTVQVRLLESANYGFA